MKTVWLLTLVTCALLLSGCGSSDTVNVVLAGEDIFFDVIDIDAQVGQTIEVQFTNTGTLEHNFVLPEFDIETPILKPGESTTFSFTAAEPGEYVYICSVPGHETLMHGKLVVTE